MPTYIAHFSGTYCIKGTVDEISSDPPLIKWQVRFSTVPLNT